MSTVKFYINNSPLFQTKIDISQNLIKVREICKSKMLDDTIFLSSDDCEIDIDDESLTSLSEIIFDGIIYMSSKTF